MKKTFVFGLILAIALFLVASTAPAITIGFEPISQRVLVGDPVDVAVTISDLGLGTAPSLGVFDLDVNFDPAILTFDSVAFGDPVLGDQLDLFGLGSITAFDDSIPGSVNLFELSLDLPSDLDAFQADSFTLATLTIDTFSVGTSSLDITINALGDSLGDMLPATLESGSISPVPEPATMLLLGTGLACLGVFSRKKLRKR